MSPISIAAGVGLVITLIVGGIIFGLLTLLVDRAPFMPDAWKPIIKYLLLALGVLVLIGVLLNFAGVSVGPIFRP